MNSAISVTVTTDVRDDASRPESLYGEEEVRSSSHLILTLILTIHGRANLYQETCTMSKPSGLLVYITSFLEASCHILPSVLNYFRGSVYYTLHN